MIIKKYLWIKYMFIGSHIHNLDDKNRLSVPKKWKTLLGNNVVLTTGLDKSLFLFNKKDWLIIYNKINTLSLLDKKSRDFSRFMLSNAFEIEIDKHNRILIPEILKSFAELKDEIVFSGVGDRLEIWSKSKFDNLIKNINKDADNLAQSIKSIQDNNL